MANVRLFPPWNLLPTPNSPARLTLTLPNDTYYVMLEDHIPAGTEILDQTLKTSQLGEDEPTSRSSMMPTTPLHAAGAGGTSTNRRSTMTASPGQPTTSPLAPTN